MSDLETSLRSESKTLNANQIRLRNRMLLLLGNTYVTTGDIEIALEHYSEAVKGDPNNVYALASAAQCLKEHGDSTLATEHFQRALLSLDRTGDFRKKRERGVRAVIAVTAANAARYCGDVARYDQYSREAREMLTGNLDVDGLSPKFFSPATKRLVSSADLLSEIQEGSRVAQV